MKHLVFLAMLAAGNSAGPPPGPSNWFIARHPPRKKTATVWRLPTSRKEPIYFFFEAAMAFLMYST